MKEIIFGTSTALFFALPILLLVALFKPRLVFANTSLVASVRIFIAFIIVIVTAGITAPSDNNVAIVPEQQVGQADKKQIDEKPEQAKDDVVAESDQKQTEQAKQAKQEQNSGQIKPESIVKFPKSNIACLTREGLQKVMEHGVKGEETKMKSLFISEDNPEGECLMLDSNKKYKVISSEYNNPNIPEAGLLEIVGVEKKSASAGAFVLVLSKDMVKIVKSAR